MMTVFKSMLWKNRIPSKALLKNISDWKYFCENWRVFNISTEKFYISRRKLLPLQKFPSRKGHMPRDVYIHLSLNTWTTLDVKSWAWISGPIVSKKLAYSFLVLGNDCCLSTDLYTLIKPFHICFCSGSS